MLILLWACLSLYILLTIDLWSFALGRNGWSRFISSFLFFYAQVVGTEFLLGLAFFLQSYSLLVLNVLLSSLLLLFLHKTFGDQVFPQYFTALRKATSAYLKNLKSDPLWLALSAIGLGFLAWIVFLGVIFPVVDWDGNSYHLSYVAGLIQSHKIYDLPTSITWLSGYPKGGELMQAWPMLITHNDLLADLYQVPFLFLGIYALYEVALSLGARKKDARFAASLFFFLPIVMNQLKTTYVDVATCALFFSGLALVIKKKLSELDLVLIGIDVSLLISMKSGGPLFILVLLPLLFWSLYKTYGRKTSSYLKALLLMGLPLSFGLYWYIKDWILYGSPIYPFGYKIAGVTLFHGQTFQQFSNSAITTTILPHLSYLHRIWFVWTEQKDWYGCFYNYDTNYAGLGPIWFIILLPAAIVSFLWAIVSRRRKVLGVMGTLLALFIIYPLNYYSRYTMFIVAAGILGLSLLLPHMSRLTNIAVKLTVISLALFVIFTNFTLCNFPPGAVRTQFKSFISGQERGPTYANVPGQAYVFLESRVKPRQVVAYDSKPFFVYPLWLSNYSNKVIYIPASNEASWYSQVKQDHVKYVFTTLISKENQWANQRLKEIYKDQMYEIFQVY